MKAAVTRLDEIGAKWMDPVELTIEGERIALLKSYQVAMSVFSQPSAFTATIGGPEKTEKLFRRFKCGQTFQMSINGTVVQTGKIDRIAASSLCPTDVSISGRDSIAQLYDSKFIQDCSLRGTYLSVTKEQLAAVGLGDRTVHSDQNAMKAFVLGKTVVKVPAPVTMCPAPGEPLVVSDPIEMVVSNSVQAHAGESRYEWLKTQYRKVGLYLWSLGDGDFALFQPNPNQVPVYQIVRKAGGRHNILSHEYEEKTDNRHSSVTVVGRGGGVCDGRKQISYTWTDTEMEKLGIIKPMMYRDNKIKKVDEAKATARRIGLKERRDGWKLSYRVTGHMVTSLIPSLGLIPWVPDFVVAIADEELGIFGNFYLSDVDFMRSNGGTTTHLRFMRLEDVETIASDN